MNSEAKRILLAFILTFGFLLVWTKYFSPKPVVTSTTSAPFDASQKADPSTTPLNAPTSGTSTTSSSAMMNSSATKTIAIEPFDVKTNEMIGSFSNQSGTLTSVQLTQYKKELKKDSDLVHVVPLSETATAPLLWNLSFRSSASSSPEVSLSDQNTIYQWGEKSPDHVSFTTNVNPKIVVTKEYRVGKQPYVIEQIVKIENRSSTPYYVDANTSIAATHNPNSKSGGFLIFQPRIPDVTAVAYAHDESIHWSFPDFAKGKVQSSVTPIDWSGFASQYFLLTAIPVDGVWSGLKGDVQNDVATLKMDYPQRSLAANSNLEYSIKLYAGPKQMEILESVTPTLDQSIQLGSWIGGLARLIHKLLGGIYKFIPNYGWAIILLTVLVRLAVFPLAQMQAKSMKRMALHKPAMDALKAKHENDKEAYSRELMTYMRTNRINPASGCLPLLIQFPVFIALYRVLYNSIELRHAPFMFWIHDLSAHDPFFVLPVFVGITFFLQTKLNPTPMADPAQQTMMKIMPIMFSVFMIFLPSGLNLYIFVSTLWGIAQQYMVQKQLT